MHIWIFNHYATPPDTPGGTRHYDFARALTKFGHHITIFASSFSHRTRKEERLQKGQTYYIENIDGVEFVWLKTTPYYGSNDWRRTLNMLSYAARVIPVGMGLKEKPDVILATSPHPFAGLAGWISAIIRRAKFVFEVRDLWPQTLIDIGGYNRKSPVVLVLRMLEKFLYNTSSKIVVLHPKAIDYITKLGINSNKILYIPNGINPEIFIDINIELPQKLNTLITRLKSQCKIIIVYTGAHGIANALETILESARSLQNKKADNIHFIFIGDGPEKQQLVEKAEKLKLGNIDFLDPVSKKEIPVLLKACDITILSYKKSDLYVKYGMSTNKLWDYMIAAKPIVWAIDSANDPVAEAHCGITVPPEDAEALANAIINIISMSDKDRHEMGIRGYEYVMKYHSIPILAQKLAEVLEDARRN